MKVLHYILDGLAPSSNENILELVNPNYILNKYGYELAGKHETWDKSRSKYWSHINWPRLYSKLETTKLSEATARFNPNETPEDEIWKSRCDVIPPEAWIWNKLSHIGIPSFTFPYYLIRLITKKNLFESNNPNNDLINMMIRGYHTYYHVDIKNGELSHRIKSPYSYWYFCDIIDRLNKSNYPETHDEVMKMWKDFRDTGDDKYIKPIIDITRKEMIPKLYEKIKENNGIMFEELIPAIQEFVQGKDSYYVNVGLCESDNLCHFGLGLTKEYVPDIRDNYLNPIMDKIIEVTNPDVIILAGDHGTRLQSEELDGEAEGDKYSGYLDIGDGKKIWVKKSHYSWTIFCAEHSNSNGCYVFTKPGLGVNPSELIQMNIDKNISINPEYMTGDAVYDTLVNEEFWK